MDIHQLVTELSLSWDGTAMLAASATGAVAIAAPHFVSTLYGARWTGVVTPLQVLLPIFPSLYHLGGVVAHSVG
jgi:O-antigen/teichoic acid export membrane protein